MSIYDEGQHAMPLAWRLALRKPSAEGDGVMGDVGDYWREHRECELESTTRCLACGEKTRKWDACPDCGAVSHISDPKKREKVARRERRREIGQSAKAVVLTTADASALRALAAGISISNFRAYRLKKAGVINFVGGGPNAVGMAWLKETV